MRRNELTWCATEGWCLNIVNDALFTHSKTRISILNNSQSILIKKKKNKLSNLDVTLSVEQHIVQFQITETTECKPNPMNFNILPIDDSFSMKIKQTNCYFSCIETEWEKNVLKIIEEIILNIVELPSDWFLKFSFVLNSIHQISTVNKFHNEEESILLE